jgi:transcriptional regulator with XRE-family HTH domain
MTGVELKRRREEMGFSQSEMAKALRVSVRTYQGWESGRPFPDFLEMALDSVKCRECQKRRKGRGA